MACNCATTEQLNALYKKYGEKKDESLSSGQKFRMFFYMIGVGICLIFITPIIVCYALYKAFGTEDRTISVKKFFRLKNRKLATHVG